MPERWTRQLEVLLVAGPSQEAFERSCGDLLRFQGLPLGKLVLPSLHVPALDARDIIHAGAHQEAAEVGQLEQISLLSAHGSAPTRQVTEKTLGERLHPVR